MLTRTIRQVFSTAHPLIARFFQPAPLKIITSPNLPKLAARPNKEILENWWSLAPFDTQKSELVAPVFSFKNGTYTGQAIELNQDIFNQPLRRDLIYRLYHWRVNLNKIRTHHTKTLSEVSGSGIKPRPQKGQGAARVGKKRAPGRYHGSKAHGAKPKVYSYHLNDKIKLMALKCLLSSRLFEGKIRIVDSEVIEEAKTKLVAGYLENNLEDRATACLIISSGKEDPEATEKFLQAQQNIQRIKCYTAADFDVLDVMKLDRLIITKKGLEELTENILKSTYAIHRQPHMPELIEPQSQEQQAAQTYDPSQPPKFRFKILEDYLKLYERIKAEEPERLQVEMARVSKVTVPSVQSKTTSSS